MDPVDPSEFAEDPLRDDSPEVWDRLVQALGPASMLVCIQDRMGSALRAHASSEDVWQETLLHVWRDRGRCEWRGLRPFRRWVLQVVENRIRDMAERLSAAKRGGGRPDARLDADPGEGALPPPVASTTPSRVAAYLEDSRAMHAALEQLPAELREVVRLRLFEELPVDEVAQRLSIGVSAVKHRFRKGAASYQVTLEGILADRSRGGN